MCHSIVHNLRKDFFAYVRSPDCYPGSNAQGTRTHQTVQSKEAAIIVNTVCHDFELVQSNAQFGGAQSKSGRIAGCQCCA